MPTHPIPDVPARAKKKPRGAGFTSGTARKAAVRRWSADNRVDESIRILAERAPALTADQLDQLGALLRDRKAA